MKTFDGTPDSLILGQGQLAMPIVTMEKLGSHPLITVNLPEPDNACPHFRIALCLFSEALRETQTETVRPGARFRTTIPDKWLPLGYHLYAVTYNANKKAFWLASQFTSGGRMLLPFETSDTFRIAVT